MAFDWTPLEKNDRINAQHIEEIVENLDVFANNLGVDEYEWSSIVTPLYGKVVKRDHLEELRDAADYMHDENYCQMHDSVYYNNHDDSENTAHDTGHDGSYDSGENSSHDTGEDSSIRSANDGSDYDTHDSSYNNGDNSYHRSSDNDSHRETNNSGDNSSNEGDFCSTDNSDDNSSNETPYCASDNSDDNSSNEESYCPSDNDSHNSSNEIPYCASDDDSHNGLNEESYCPSDNDSHNSSNEEDYCPTDNSNHQETYNSSHDDDHYSSYDSGYNSSDDSSKNSNDNTKHSSYTEGTIYISGFSNMALWDIFNEERTTSGGSDGGPVYDGNYVYTNTFKKMNKDTLEIVAEINPDDSDYSNNYDGAICADNNYVYIHNANMPNRIFKIRKSDWTIVDDTGSDSWSGGSDNHAFAVDNNYLYFIYGEKIYKLDKDNLSVVSESVELGNGNWEIMLHGSYIYTARNKLNKSDLSVVSSVEGLYYEKMAMDDNYLYVVRKGNLNDHIGVFDLTNMERITSTEFGGVIGGHMVRFDEGGHSWLSTDNRDIFLIDDIYNIKNFDLGHNYGRNKGLFHKNQYGGQSRSI